MVDIFRPPYFQPVSVNGVPLAGAKLYFYTAGTTTPITVYQDVGLSTPHASPVVADASGIFAAIYVNTASYKIALYTSADVLVKTYDNVNSPSLFDSLYTKGTDIATASTLDLDSATGPFIDLTGTTTVTGVTLTSGRQRTARAVGAFRLTASSTLVVNGSTSASYTTNAGDLLMFEGYSAGVVRVWVISTAPYGLSPYPPGTLYGLTMSNNAGTPASKIDVAVGACRNGADTANIDLLADLTAKDLDTAWSAGSSAGARFTGVVSDTTWHGYLIKRPDTGAVDFGFSTNATNPTGDAGYPAAYTIYRRIGSLLRRAGSIAPFTQKGDYFYFNSRINERSSTAALADALLGLTVPFGISVSPILGFELTIGATSNVSNLFGSAAVGASTIVKQQVSSSVSTTQVSTSVGEVWTNTSVQIYYNVVISAGTITANVLFTYGWIDPRGRW